MDDASGPGRKFSWMWAIVWWVVLIAIAMWSANVALSPQKVTTLDYSAFLSDVRASDVTNVTIAGDQITGMLKRPAGPFITVFPATVGDRGLLPLLEQHGVTITAASSASPWYITLAENVLPWIILAALILWMTNGVRGQGGAGPLGTFGRSKPQRYESDGRPAVTFADVAGIDEVKDALQEEVDFLRNPRKYRDLGARIPRGVLLVGPPGTGKTLLARALAGEAGVPFLSLNASEFVEMFVGVGASRVRDLFAQAKERAPAIVFIDELDAVGRRRGAGIGTVNDEREQTLNQLLAELDGFDQRLNVIILAATNRPDVLDPALLRPGRFDRQIEVELPDLAGREAILRVHSRKIPLAGGVDLHEIAAATIGMSGADLENLCNEAALRAARRNGNAVSRDDFDDAMDRLRMGTQHPRLSDPAERRVIAYHEAGHAVAAWMNPYADPVRKVTIMPHGRSLGHTEQLPTDDRHNFTRAYLQAHLVVALAGRTSEELVTGEPTTGAESDLVDATTLARRMVTRWAMGGNGLAAYPSDEEQPFLGYAMAQGRDYSEATAARIDREVAQLLDQAHDEARRTLAAARDRLDRLADALMKRETVASEELEALLGKRNAPSPELLPSGASS